MADCEACCTDDGGASTLDNVKYERAILEVCGWRLGAYPQVAFKSSFLVEGCFFKSLIMFAKRLRRSSRASGQRGIPVLPSSMWGVQTQSLRWDSYLTNGHSIVLLKWCRQVSCNSSALKSNFPWFPFSSFIYWPLQLLDEDEEVAEELAISKWNTDSVEEFLDTVMVKNEEEEIDITENLI